MNVAPKLSPVPVRLTLATELDEDAYGEGCDAGQQLATKWRMNPCRGNLSRGATLSHYLLTLAEALVQARDNEQRSRVRGALVGFAFEVEHPQCVEACDVMRRVMATARGGFQ